MKSVSWVGEIPLPSSNLEIAAESYVLEQWLRRIAHAALMAKGGSSWPSCVPADLLAKAKEGVNKLRRRTYLDPESSDNLIVLPSPRSKGERDALSIVWPRDVTRREFERIRDFAVAIRANSHTPYAEQDPKYICDPLIWFEGGWEGSTTPRTSR